MHHDPEATARAIAHFENAYRTGERPGDVGAIELAIAALYTYRRLQMEAAGRRVTVDDYATGELDGVRNVPAPRPAPPMPAIERRPKGARAREL